MKDIRKLYEKLGAEEYYKRYGDRYQNPHNEQVSDLLQQNASRLDYSKVLDFCAGGGEVSLALRGLGYEVLAASDPYTHALYEQKVGKPCQSWSFDEVVKEGIEGKYSTIICSFAMHLCLPEKLYALSVQLFQHSANLVIITPHKRPVLEKFEGIFLQYKDYVLTPKGKKVFLKHYRSAYRLG